MNQPTLLRQFFSLTFVTLLLAACSSASSVTAPAATATLTPTPEPPAATPTPTLAAPTATTVPTPVPPATTPTAVPSPDPPDYSQYSYEELVHVFDYDQDAPLNIEEVAVSDEDGVTVHDLTYAGAADERVEALLVVPSGEGPFAAVMYMHQGAGSKYQFLEEATGLAQHGVVSLLVQGSWNRDSQNFWRHIINLRRGADLLTARPDVDRDRLAYVGHSWGGSFGGLLAGVDQRFKTYVLMAGLPYWSGRGEQNDMIPFDAVRYVDKAAPSSLFFQAATKDFGVSQETSTEYYEAGSEPKRLEWYEAGHALNEKAREDRVVWLAQELGLP